MHTLCILTATANHCPISKPQDHHRTYTHTILTVVWTAHKTAGQRGRYRVSAKRTPSALGCIDNATTPSALSGCIDNATTPSALSGCVDNATAPSALSGCRDNATTPSALRGCRDNAYIHGFQGVVVAVRQNVQISQLTWRTHTHMYTVRG